MQETESFPEEQLLSDFPGLQVIGIIKILERDDKARIEEDTLIHNQNLRPVKLSTSVERI